MLLRRQLRLMPGHELARMVSQRNEAPYLEVSAGNYPPLNIWRAEKGGGLIIQAIVPGLAADEIDIRLEGRRLVLSGAISGAEQTGRIERRRGAFRREVRLPFAVAEDGIEARLEYGIMTLRLQPAATAEPRRIAVENGR